MTIEKFLNSKIITDTTSKAWELLVRVEKALMEKGIEPYAINYMSMGKKKEVGEKYISIRTVYRSNGTEEDVSVKIEVYEKINKYSSKRIESIKVPKDASDKVINNRIEKAIKSL